MSVESIVSNEYTAYYRSIVPEISKDFISGELCSSQGAKFAKKFQREVYPLVARHISVRSRYFFEHSIELVKRHRIERVVSLGVGLSLLSYWMSKRVNNLKFVDTDLEDVINARRERFEGLGSKHKTDFSKFEQKPFDLIAQDKADGSLSELTKGVPTLFVMEGVSFFLPLTTLKWLFKSLPSLDVTSAFLFDYWPDYVTTSKVYQSINKDYEESDSGKVKATFSIDEIDQLTGRSNVTDVEVREAEKMFSDRPEMGNANEIVAARFRSLVYEKPKS